MAHEPVPGLALSVYVQNLRDVRVIDEAWSTGGPRAGASRATTGRR